MTNYERICADKAFCAAVIASACGYDDSLDPAMRWLDAEQREVSDETEATNDNQSGL